MNSIIKIQGYNLTEDPSFLDRQNHMTPYLKDMMDELYSDIQKGNKSVIPLILRLIEKFPRNPQLKNFLSVAYNNIGNIEKREEVNQWILKEHPDYLFGILNKAASCLLRKEFDQVQAILGENIELKELYPNREVFHVSEFTSFTKFAIQYFFEIGYLGAAESRLNLLSKLFPDHPDTISILEWYQFRLFQIGATRPTEEQGKSKFDQNNPFSEPQTRENPIFVHPEIYHLYEFDLSIPHIFIENILALSRRSVIADLEMVLNDSISRFRYFQELHEKEGIGEDKLTFPLHAILLLGELRAKESLETIFRFLSFENDFLIFWLGDHKTETIYEPLYYLGESQLDQLKAFMFRPNIDIYVKTSVLTAVQQVYIYQPHRKNEVISWFDQVIDFFIENVNNQSINDSDLLAFIVSDIVDIRELRLLPGIERLFRYSYINEEICGTIQAVRLAIERNGNVHESKRDLLDILNRYLGFTGTFLPERKRKVENILKNSPIIPFDHKSEMYTKVGKSDLCPCGSGLNFEDCCINRLN